MKSVFIGFVAIAALGALNTQNHAWAGNGSDRGGGGGDYLSSQLGWRTVGAPGRVVLKSYEDEIRTFQRHFPTYKLRPLCPKMAAEMKVPSLPDLAEYLEFLVQNPDGKIEYLEASEICTSKALIASFGRLLMTLAEASRDPFTHELLAKTHSLGGKIPMVITDHPFLLPSVTGEQMPDNSAYDPIGKQILWFSAPAKESVGGHWNSAVAVALERQPVALFRHEVTHALLQRAMGTAYPLGGLVHYGRKPMAQDCSMCKDLEEGLYCQCAQTGDSNNSFLQWVTDYKSALIEGICDWAETGRDGIGHPYNPDNVVEARFDDTTASACFYGVAEGGIDFSQLTSNEAQVNGALRELQFDRWYDKASKSNQGQINEEKRRSILQAISNGPSNIPQLAKKFDEIRGSQDGLKWMRKFFAFDYKDTRTLRSRLIRETPLGERFQKVCLSKDDSTSWFPDLIVHKR